MVSNQHHHPGADADASDRALRISLEQLLAGDGDEDARRELARLAEHRHSTAALVQALIAIDDRLGRFEEMLAALHEAQQRPSDKQWYTVSEVAEMLGKAEFTVREWCRLGRVYASKRACGRGNAQEWIISDAEIERIRNEGLLPM